jgi:5'(3')-deoxyribonucleotidase
MPDTLGAAVKRIAIDIDSTLHHYWDQLREVVLRRHGVDLPYEHQTTWDITTLPQEHVAAAVLETHSEPHVLAAVPYPGAVETVRAWHEAGHFIHITSHRTTAAHDVTARWLDSVGLPHDELYCSYDKISRCVEIGIDVLIDDSPVNLTRAHERGIVPATIRHPWNAELCAREGFVCADDWAELEHALAPVLAA